MANRIKGITVEIGGDTTKLDKALSGVNKEIKTTQSELKDVERLLKLDPSNTELLAQKQKLLKEAIGQTNDKLKALKDAQEQAKRQLESGELGQDKYDALCREIQATEIELRRLTDQAEKAGTAMSRAFEQAGEKMKAAGKKISDIGGTLTKSVTAPVAAIGTASVATAANFESAMSQVQATMGITTDATTTLNGKIVNTKDALADLATQMGSSTAFSASQCAEALNYLALAGYDAQQMADTLPTVLNIAAAGGMELAQASDMVTDAMSALGMNVSDAGLMVDQMAKTASSTNTSVAQLGEGILKIGATAKSIKGGTAELNTALGILANNGIKSAEGGTHLRNVILSLQNPTDAASKSLERLGIKVYDSEGNMRSMNNILGDLNRSMDGMTNADKDNIIANIFNKTDLAAVNALLANTGSTWDDLQSSITNSAGSAQQMADTQLDNLQGQLTLLKSAVEGLMISIGKTVMPIVKSLVEGLQKLVDWLNSLDESTRNIIVVISLVMAAVGPLLIFVGKVITSVGAITSGIPKMISAIKTLGTAIKGLFGIIMAHPFVAIIAAVAALIVALVNLYNNNEEFRKEVDIIWNAILLTIQDVIDAIVGFFTETIPDAFTTAVEAVGDFCQGVIDFFVNLGRGIGTTIGNIASSIINGIMAAVDFITSLPGKALQWGIDFVQGLINGITSMAGKVIDAVSSVADTIFGWLHFSRPDEGPLRKYETWMPDFMNGLAEGIKDNKWRIENAVSDVAKAMTINAGDVVGATTNTAVYNTTKVYLGDKELTAQLTGGVVKSISNTQEAGARMKGAAYV